MSQYITFPQEGVPTYPSAASLPAMSYAGALAVTTDTYDLYVYESGTGWVILSSGGGGGSVTAVTASAPLASSGGTTPNISITQSGVASDGYLSSVDWNTFNNKQAALTPGSISETTSSVLTISNGSNSTVGPNVTIQVKQSSGAQSGYLSSSDWNTFNNKQNALSFGDLTDVGTDGITITGGTGAVIGSGTSISQHVADSTHNGYLSSSDWSTFNAKQPSGSYITALTGDVSASGPGSAAATVNSVGGSSAANINTAVSLVNGSNAANTVFASPDGSPGAASFRLLVSNDIPDLSATYVTQAEVGSANGVVPLDGSSKIPVTYLPSVVMEYQGSWDPSTNTPTLSDGTGTNGYVYYVSAAFAGPVSGLNDPSMYNFQIGDIIIYSGSLGAWQLTTPAAGVQSVNGAQGVVTVNAINQLTGDVAAGPASGSQSQSATIQANVVSNSKLAQMAAHTFKGNNTGSTANASDLTQAQLTAELNQFTSSLQGVVPGSGGGTVNFLRADGSWATPPNSGGTVTSVALADGSSTPIYGISGSPVTGSGTLTFSLQNQNANLVFAGPSTGSPAEPSFRSLVVADIPSLPYASSTLTSAHIYVGNGSNVATDTAMSGDITINNTGVTAIGANKVTNSQLAQMAAHTVKGNNSGSTANASDLALSSVTETGSAVLTITNGSNTIVSASNLTIQVSQSTTSTDGYLSSTDWNTFNGKQAAGNYITALTGDVTASGPGSAAATIANNAVSNAKFRQSAALSVVGNSTNATANVADISAASDNQILRRSGTSIGFGSIDLAQSNAVGSSILPVANGGTGQSSYTNGQLLIGNTTGNTLTKATLTAGAGISITNGGGSITIATADPSTSAISASDIDWSTLKNTGGLYTKTLGANTTFTFSNRTTGQTIVVRLTNTVSNYTVTWPTVKWAGGTPPTMSTGAVSDIYTFIYDGTDVFGSYVQNLS